jgi:predicted acylesterase/phospholipase RssA
MSDAWANLHTHDVWKLWNYNPEDWITNERGIVSNEPLLDYMKKILEDLGGKVQRRWTLAATDVSTGDYRLFNNTNVPDEDLHKAAVASAAIPAFFPF